MINPKLYQQRVIEAVREKQALKETLVAAEVDGHRCAPVQLTDLTRIHCVREGRREFHPLFQHCCSNQLTYMSPNALQKRHSLEMHQWIS